MNRITDKLQEERKRGKEHERFIIETILPERREFEPKTSITLKSHEHLTYIFLYADGVHTKKQLSVTLVDGSRVSILGLFLGNKDQHYELDIQTVHKGKGTEALTNVRGVLMDSARCDFKGLIKIPSTGNQTNAQLEEHVLLLGEDTQSTVEPTLEIEAPDVKASHATTTGRVDDQQLFYCRSRGIQEGMAKRMIVEGFVNDILSRVPSKEIQAAFQDVMQKRIDTLNTQQP